MKIGFSLTPDFIAGIPSCGMESRILKKYGSTNKFLKELKDSGVYSIELREIKRTDVEDQINKLTGLIFDTGLEVSVHGQITDIEFNVFEKIYPSLSGLVKELTVSKKKAVFVIHAFGGTDRDMDFYTKKTGRIIKNWTLMDLPLVFALEINRYKEEKIDPSASMESLLNIIEPVPEVKAGFCFDFGHYLYNRTIRPEDFDDMAPEGFLKRTVHTHIHGLKNLRTHHLFEDDKDIPLRKYVNALRSAGYEGIYNIEFSFERFPEDSDAENAVFRCIRKLQNI